MILCLGTAILSERPLLFVEADPDFYLKADGADPRLGEMAAALGDAPRLVIYIAFMQLHERKQKDFLAFWRENIEAEPLAKAIATQNRVGVEAFLMDRPHFKNLINWKEFVKVVSIFARFGMTNLDGSRAVYTFCSHLKHSCQPNASCFTLSRSFPKGRKMLYVIGLEGIPRGAEINVNQSREEVLLLPKRKRALKLHPGLPCSCAKCSKEDDSQDRLVTRTLTRLQHVLGVKPPSVASTDEARQCIKELDRLLPFSMQMKAKAKVLLAQALQELTERAAWQEANRQANIIMWAGLDVASQELRLKETKTLYETAAKDFEYVLGQEAIPILDKLDAEHEAVNDQYKMFARYRERMQRGVEQPNVFVPDAPLPELVEG